ncbi:hypothetical protein [Butyrivibrio sp. VCD2006]|uniref:hypothetical protein n=1 Tax=Butyrivibrio sp. VCD2006 TaxID=1280664 RepID=UPI0003FB2574|nr:hypothetical protein [Butyrivibrio sp. VCD2006]
MDYYTATLREPGIKPNNDGLMIKGIHFKNRPDMVVMVISCCKMNPKLCDKVIRTAERLVYKAVKKDMARALKRLSVIFGSRGFLIKRKIPDITVLIFDGIDYLVMNRGNNRVLKIDRLGTNEISCKPMENKNHGVCAFEGRLMQGSTLVAANQAFYERQLDTEIFKRLCPQMCIDDNEMQKNMEYLRSQLWSRGEIRPITAAAVCLK